MFDCDSEPYLIFIIVILSITHMYNYIYKYKKSSIENTTIINRQDEYIDI
mgnify:CR=1 FL=1